MADPASVDPPGTWRTCRFCGVATPDTSPTCVECGADKPLTAADIRSAPKRLRRRVLFTGALRTLIVVGVVAALAYATVSAVLSGPPSTAGDPLTTSAGYEVGPGNFTEISGEITGGDYVIGNYSSFDPVGMEIEFVVYNSSEWSSFTAGENPTPTYAATEAYSGRIVYTADVTDNYYFVFTNPYSVTTHLTYGIYVATEYESNVGDDGFG